jgi:hypothetical protein
LLSRKFFVPALQAEEGSSIAQANWRYPLQAWQD